MDTGHGVGDEVFVKLIKEDSLSSSDGDSGLCGLRGGLL